MSNHDFNSYFIVSDVSTATKIIDILKNAKVKEESIGVVSNDSDIALADLPEADLSEKSKLPQALVRGALLGSGSGLMAGVLLTVFPVAGIALGGAAIAGMTAGGAAFGAWSASMIGISENSPLVKKFEDSLDDKKTLIFCHMSDQQDEKVSQQVSVKIPSEKVEKGEIE